MNNQSDLFRRLIWFILLSLPIHFGILEAQDWTNPYDVLKNSLTFYTSFDHSLTADYAKGDGILYQSRSYDQSDEKMPNVLPENIVVTEGGGYTGNALSFREKMPPVIYHAAKDNISFSEDNWSGTISLWLRLNPEEDLAPGYTDPIQITDVGYDDAAFWVDFSDKNPRQFRMGIFGDRDIWNPDNIGPDENPRFMNRLVVAKKRPFSRDSWTHVVISFSELNSSNGTASFFIDGELQGMRKIPEPFNWNLDKAKIYLGLNYVGDLDEVALFNRALTQREVMVLHKWDGGLQATVAE